MKRLLLTILSAATLSIGCGEKEEEAVATVAGGVPRAQSIQLTSLFDPSIAVADGEQCEDASMDGLFGLALGAACHVSPMAANLLIGESTPEDFTCDDYNEANEDDYGLLISLICNPDFPARLQRVAAEDAGEGDAFAISFEKFSEKDVAGQWSRGSADSYPADIRIWLGDSLATAQGFIAIHLESPDEGTVYLTGFPGDDDATFDWKFKIDFKNVADTSSCATAPSKDTCHSQDVKIYGGEDGITDGPPNGLNLSLLADSKKNPEFMAIEGKYRYTASTASTGFVDEFAVNSGLQDVRQIYFQTIKKSTQLYGKFFFRGEDSELLTYNVGDTDIFELVSNGNCSNIGDDDSDFDECTEITATDYDGIWQGETGMLNITESPVDVTIGSAPAAGVVIAE